RIGVDADQAVAGDVLQGHRLDVRDFYFALMRRRQRFVVLEKTECGRGEGQAQQIAASPVRSHSSPQWNGVFLDVIVDARSTLAADIVELLGVFDAVFAAQLAIAG